MGRLLIFALTFIGCVENIDAVIDIDTSVDDVVGPEISHEPITAPQVFGQSIWIEANAEDKQGDVWLLVVEYQSETSAEWTEVPLNKVGGGLFQGQIDGKDVRSGGMRYYLRGIDPLGNESCLPRDCDLTPWHFSVVPAG